MRNKSEDNGIDRFSQHSKPVPNYRTIYEMRLNNQHATYKAAPGITHVDSARGPRVLSLNTRPSLRQPYHILACKIISWQLQPFQMDSFPLSGLLKRAYCSVGPSTMKRSIGASPRPCFSLALSS